MLRNNKGQFVSKYNHYKGEWIKLFLEGITLKEISEEYKADIKTIKSLIGNNWNKLKKKCRYCDKEFYKKDYPLVFHRMIVCGSKKCKQKHHNLTAEKKWREGNGRIWKENNIEHIKKNSRIYKENNKEYFRQYERERWIRYKEGENKRRKKIGLPLIGDGFFYQESILFLLISKLFPNEEIRRRDRKTIGLELDIYLPDLKFAIEFQGYHHFVFPNFFHKTKERFELNQWRDEKKRELCKEKGIILIEISEFEKLSEQLILSKLKRFDIKCYQKKLKIKI